MSDVLSIGPHQGQHVVMAGQPLTEATAAMILVHGRGATAENILELAQDLPHPEMAYLAPQAAQHTWYPYSFLVPIAQNEPWLSSALQVLADLVAQVELAGIAAQRIVIAGFSQGACLAAESAARHARRYGGLLFLFSGGVIGPPGTPRAYAGSLAGTPVFWGAVMWIFMCRRRGCRKSAVLLRKMGGTVNVRIYSNIHHH
ncbi:MAG: phospholipase [Chloroflexota bacterium]